jgi:hypothetical protein
MWRESGARFVGLVLTSGVESLIGFWPPRRMSEPSTQKLKRRSMDLHRAALPLSDRETTIK